MELFPPMPLASWHDTKQTLHRFCQVVGKLRLAASVRRNHWWNVPFHLTGRGITTRPMGQVDGNPIFTIDFDFIDHQLRIHTLDGRWHTFDIAHTRFADRRTDQPLQPAAAWWDPRDGSHLAVLRYDDARTTSDPRATVLEFYESAYQAGARLAGWDIRRLACPGGITDPHLRRKQDQSEEA